MTSLTLEYFIVVSGSNKWGHQAIETVYYTDKDKIQKKVDKLNETFKDLQIDMTAYVRTV